MSIWSVPHCYPDSQLIPLSRVPLNTYCRSAVQEIICSLCNQHSVPRATTIYEASPTAFSLKIHFNIISPSCQLSFLTLSETASLCFDCTAAESCHNSGYKLAPVTDGRSRELFFTFRTIRRRHYEPQSPNCHTFHIRVWRGFQTCHIHEVPKWWRHGADGHGESCFYWKGYNLTGTNQLVTTAQKYGCEDIIRHSTKCTKTLKWICSYVCVAQMAVSKHCTYVPSRIYLLNTVIIYRNSSIGT